MTLLRLMESVCRKRVVVNILIINVVNARRPAMWWPSEMLFREPIKDPGS